MQNTVTITSNYFEKRDLQIAADEIVVLSCMRNEGQRLPYFLEYYRRMGVSRFLLVDNDSSDGTEEFLRAQPDVEYFRTSASYRGSAAGRLWLQELADTYAVDRWVITADVDELLVFPGAEAVGLGELCAYLDAESYLGLFTIMLDMYSDRPMSETVYEKGTDFLSTCEFFETDTYRLAPGENPPFLSIFGGPRGRLFRETGQKGSGPMMKKIPLVRWQRGFSYMFSTHSHRFVQLADVTGVLLHFKFFNTFEEVAARDAKRGDRRQQAHYSAYQSTVGADLCFHNDQSRRYETPSDLVRLGVMRSTPAYEKFLTRQMTADADAPTEVLARALPEPSQSGAGMTLRSLASVWPLIQNPKIARYFGRDDAPRADNRPRFLQEMLAHVKVIDVRPDHLVLSIGEPALHRWHRSHLGVAVYVGSHLVQSAVVDGTDTALRIDVESLESNICRLDADIYGAAREFAGEGPVVVTVYLFDALNGDRLEAHPASPEAQAQPDDRMIHSGVWYSTGAATGPRGPYRGVAERLSEGNLRGWVYDVGRDTFRVPVTIYMNGRLVRSTVADRRRRDLNKFRVDGSSAQPRGFLVPLPFGYFEDNGVSTVTVEVFAAGTNVQLRRSPITLAAKVRDARWQKDTRSWMEHTGSEEPVDPEMPTQPLDEESGKPESRYLRRSLRGLMSGRTHER